MKINLVIDLALNYYIVQFSRLLFNGLLINFFVCFFSVEIQILDKRSQMTLEFAEFYITEQLSFGNSTTLINLIANPVERKVTLQVNAFLNLLKSEIYYLC